MLLYWEGLPPAEIVAAASIAKVAIEPLPDPRANGKDYAVSLKFSDGCESLRIIRVPDVLLQGKLLRTRNKRTHAVNTILRHNTSLLCSLRFCVERWQSNMHKLGTTQAIPTTGAMQACSIAIFFGAF